MKAPQGANRVDKQCQRPPISLTTTLKLKATIVALEEAVVRHRADMAVTVMEAVVVVELVVVVDHWWWWWWWW